MWDEYAKSIGTTANNLTQEQKIQAEVNGILEETKFQTGDAAKVAGTYSGQVSSLAYNFQNFKVAVGNALIPIAEAVLPGINAIIKGLTTLANVFAQVTSLIFGKKSSGMSAQVTTQKEIAQSSSLAADATDDLADATTGAGKASKKAAKDMKGVLLGFDELNILASNAASSMEDAASGASGAGSEIAIPSVEDGGTLFGDEEVNPKISDGIQKIIDGLDRMGEILKIGFDFSFGDVDLTPLTDSIYNIGIALQSIFSSEEVKTAASEFVDSILFALGALVGSVASIGVTIATAIFGGIEEYLSKNSEEIRNKIIKVFDIGSEISKLVAEFSRTFSEIFSVFGGDKAQSAIASFIEIFATTFGGIIELVVKFGRDIIDTITSPFIQNKELIIQALDGFLGPIASVMSSISETVSYAVEKIVALYDEHISPFIMLVKESFTEWFEHLLNGYNQYIQPVLDMLAEKFHEVVETHIKPMIDKAVEFFGNLMDAISLLWTEVLSPVVTWLIDNAVPLISTAIGALGTIFEGFLATMSDIIGAIFDILNGVVEFIVGVFTGDWEKAWNGVKEIFGGVFELITSIATNAWNMIRDVWSIVSTWFNDNVAQPVLGFFSSVWDNVVTAASGAWEGIQEAFSNVADWFHDKFSKAWQAVKDVFSAGGEIFNGIKEGILSGLKAIINGLIDGINNVISVPFKGINSALNAIKSIEILGLKPFSGLKTISVPSIPKLANGAVIPPNDQFLAILGDQRSGKNIEAPGSEIENAVANGIAKAGGSNSPVQVNINYTGSLSQLARLLNPEIQIVQNNRGGNLVSIGGR